MWPSVPRASVPRLLQSRLRLTGSGERLITEAPPPGLLKVHTRGKQTRAICMRAECVGRPAGRKWVAWLSTCGEAGIVLTFGFHPCVPPTELLCISHGVHYSSLSLCTFSLRRNQRVTPPVLLTLFAMNVAMFFSIDVCGFFCLFVF